MSQPTIHVLLEQHVSGLAPGPSGLGKSLGQGPSFAASLQAHLSCLIEAASDAAYGRAKEAACFGDAEAEAVWLRAAAGLSAAAEGLDLAGGEMAPRDWPDPAGFVEAE